MSDVFELLTPYDEEHIAVKQATKQGFILCEGGGLADLSFPTSKLRRGRVQGNGWICPTLMAGTPNIYRIEKVKKQCE